MTYSCDSSSSSSSSEDEDGLDFLLLDSLFCTKRETQGALDFRALSDTEFVENFRRVNSGILKLLKQLHFFLLSELHLQFFIVTLKQFLKYSKHFFQETNFSLNRSHLLFFLKDISW